jgi:DNA polymerase-3 subunit gamma/tau
LALQDGAAILRLSKQMAAEGVCFKSVLDNLLSVLHQITILQLIQNVSISEEDELLRQWVSCFSPEEVQLLYEIAVLGQKNLPFSPSPQVGFEMTLLRMLAFTPRRYSAVPFIQAPLEKKRKSSVWHEIVPELAVSGVTRLLAEHSSLVKQESGEWVLHLSPKQEHLLADVHIKRLEEALCQYLQQTITLSMVIASQQAVENLNPAERQEQKILLQKEAAISEIEGDEKIKHIMSLFDAKILKGSIEPAE